MRTISLCSPERTSACKRSDDTQQITSWHALNSTYNLMCSCKPLQSENAKNLIFKKHLQIQKSYTAKTTITTAIVQKGRTRKLSFFSFINHVWLLLKGFVWCIKITATIYKVLMQPNLQKRLKNKLTLWSYKTVKLTCRSMCKS